MAANSAQFARNLKTLLHRKGLTIAQASKEWGIPYFVLRRWADAGIARANSKHQTHLDKLAEIRDHRWDIDRLWEAEDETEALLKKLERHLIKLPKSRKPIVARRIEKLVFRLTGFRFGLTKITPVDQHLQSYSSHSDDESEVEDMIASSKTVDVTEEFERKARSLGLVKSEEDEPDEEEDFGKEEDEIIRQLPFDNS
jgi:hypothetical protein